MKEGDLLRKLLPRVARRADICLRRRVVQRFYVCLRRRLPNRTREASGDHEPRSPTLRPTRCGGSTHSPVNLSLLCRPTVRQIGQTDGWTDNQTHVKGGRKLLGEEDTVLLGVWWFAGLNNFSTLVCFKKV